MIQAGVRLAGISGLIAVVALGISGCAPASDGPLVGPRSAAGDIATCVPASAGAQIFFSQVLTNTGKDAVSIGEVSGPSEHTKGVEFMLDSDGPALGQVVGGSGFPPRDPAGLEDVVLARAVPAAGAVVPPGGAASLLIVITPDGGSDASIVDDISVDYTSDGEHYREEILVEYSVAPGENC